MGGGVGVSTTTTSGRSPTTVWCATYPSPPRVLLTHIRITPTLPGGKKTTVASIYTQQYATMYGSVAVPSSGMVGLGTQTGEVGRVRASGAGARVLGGGIGIGVGIVILGLVL